MIDPAHLPVLGLTGPEDDPRIAAIGALAALPLAPKVGQRLADCFELTDGSSPAEALRAAFAQAAPLDVHCRSSRHPVRLSPLPVPGERWVLVQDTGDFHRRTEKLQLERDRYRQAAEASRDGVFDFDLTTGTVWRSPQLLAQLGYAPGDLADTPDAWQALLDEEDRRADAAALEDLMAGRTEVGEVVVRCRHRTGGIIWVLVRFVGIRDDDGKLVRIRGSHTDLSDRRRLEQAWARAEQQLRDAIEAMQDGFVLFDGQERLILCNSKYLELFPHTQRHIRPGITYEEILRLDLAAGDYPDAPTDPAERENWITGRLNYLRSASGSIEVARSDGRIVRLQQYRIPDGGFVGIRTDVTLLRQREAQLRNQSHLLEAVLDVMPLHIVIRDENGAIIHANRKAAEFAGLTVAQMVGKRARDLYDAALAEQIETDDRLVLSGGNPIGLASDHVNADGAHRSFLHYIRAAEIGGRRLVIASSLDVSDRREAEIALANSEARFRDIVEGSIQGVLIVRDYRILFANPAFARMFGFASVEDALAMGDVQRLVDGDTRARIEAAWEQIRSGATNVELPQLLARRDDGTLAWVDAYLRRIQWQGRAAMQFTLVDVTQRTLAVEELLRSRSDLEAQRTRAEMANRAKSQFLAVMSHELRTPMTGVLGMVDLLLDSRLDAEQRGQLLTLRSSAEALLTLLNDLLDLSKIEADQMELERIDFDLVPLVQDVAQLFRTRAANRGTRLTVELQDDLPRILKGDPTRLRQILLNLIGNAVKFTEAGTVKVAVTAEKVPGQPGLSLRFRVTDSGIGIPPEQQARLFQPFTQADASTTRRFGGTGLGLAISRRLVNAMQGEIGLQSQPGKGSTFWFVIPVVAGNPANLHTTPAIAGGTLLVAPVRVLVAEDNEINRTLITTMLTRRGHQVTAVENGKLAVEQALGHPFDIAILDIQMPVMDGVTAARKIRAAPQPVGSLPLVALTADVMLEHRDGYLASGLDRILAKPVDWQQLDQTIAELTGAPSVDGSSVVDWHLRPLLSHATLQKLSERIGTIGLTALWEGLMPSVEAATLRMKRASDNHDWSAWQTEIGAIGRLAEQLGADRLAAFCRTPPAGDITQQSEAMLGQIRLQTAETLSHWNDRA